MGGEELKWHQLAHHHLIIQQGPHFSPHGTAKTKDNNTNLWKIVTSGTSDVAIASVYFEKILSAEVDYDNYYYYEFIARNDGFRRAPEINFCYETKARKVMVDFKFDALYW